ncbi:xanthine dehydrogenase family protein molybdopterin-binding subunit [Panacibacter sp. DH6]|uniref:Xanthine dehydrogenase family protein molybdopterin-binding subunit n=1 Tax=Panacibacter microcysteis TaxID=2793269 RepID=A0A931E301_9BACT|nr:xanthine dehydrogenase family protein molybdopterin-binding subunit [Panacibacter microcysteis]MBG9374631.1 xanthine dehydrogenase family protein molybdopterin-binding subunit [Panacibacter microcysteis]
MSTTAYDRRAFLKTGGITGGGLLVAFFVPAQAKRFLAGKEPADAVFTPNAYLNISSDNTIKVVLSHVEMGQGIWTTLPMLIAEELDCNWSNIVVEHSPPGKPYLHTVYGVQLTGGSTSTWSEFDRYRNAGATARAMLIEAAAKKLGVSPQACKTENGYVLAAGKKLSYGELAADAATLAPPMGVKLKDRKDWTIIGKAKKRLDTKAKISGQAIFGMDVHFPGMLTAVVAHAPVFGATVKSFDATAAKAVKGVTDVVQVPSGVAVIAEHFWAAKKGRDALTIEWNMGKGEALNSEVQFESYSKLAATKGSIAAEAGNTTTALQSAGTSVQATYKLPYLAHAPMEPLNCAVKLEGDGCEIWAGTQAPMWDQQRAAGILGLKPEQVKVYTTFLGGGFGRRANGTSDFVIEAVHVAKQSGKPVKLVWTREDDIRGGYYRPAFLHQVHAGLDSNGMPAAWQHTIVGQSIMAATPFAMGIQKGIDPTSVEGVNDSPYMESIPNHSITLHTPELPVTVLWWRSVGHTHTAFVMETMIDELAHTAGKDPVAYRKSLLKSKRHLAVLELVAEKSGWQKPLPQGRYRGVAVHESFGSYVAQAVEISVNNGQLKVHKVTCAIDCGIAVNPEGVKAQMESGIVFGLTAALYGEISLEKGRVKQRNFHDYKMVRMHESPVIEVHIADSNEKMGGAGEPGVPPLAPALANAVFAATGKRVRRLPVQPSDLVKA